MQMMLQERLVDFNQIHQCIFWLTCHLIYKFCHSMKLTIEEARTWYEATDAVHNFDHIMRVYNMAERLAKAEGADLEIVRAAALLHDSQGSDPGSASGRLGHHRASAKFAAAVLAEKGWEQERIEAVQHCILAHRFRNPAEKPETLNPYQGLPRS